MKITFILKKIPTLTILKGRLSIRLFHFFFCNIFLFANLLNAVANEVNETVYVSNGELLAGLHHFQKAAVVIPEKTTISNTTVVSITNDTQLVTSTIDFQDKASSTIYVTKGTLLSGLQNLTTRIRLNDTKTTLSSKSIGTKLKNRETVHQQSSAVVSSKTTLKPIFPFLPIDSPFPFEEYQQAFAPNLMVVNAEKTAKKIQKITTPFQEVAQTTTFVETHTKRIDSYQESRIASPNSLTHHTRAP